MHKKKALVYRFHLSLPAKCKKFLIGNPLVNKSAWLSGEQVIFFIFLLYVKSIAIDVFLH